MLGILVVEDSPQQRRHLVSLLTETLSGYDVAWADNRDDALARIALERPDLVLLDLIVPSAAGASDPDHRWGEDVLRVVRQTHPGTRVIIITSEGDLARDYLLDKGADDFFAKHLSDAWEHDKLPLQLDQMIGYLVCRSPAMLALRRQLGDVLCGTSFLTIQGPPGSGKEYLASVVYRRSTHEAGPLRPVSLPVLSPDELLDEVATAVAAPRTAPNSPGPGCLYVSGLEHIGHVPPEHQARLTGVLAHVRADHSPRGNLGPDGDRDPGLLVVIGSTKPLAALAREGSLDPDLHAVLRAWPVLSLPHPAERHADVPELLHVFRRRANLRHGRQVRRLGPGVVEAIQTLLASRLTTGGWDDVAQIIGDAVGRSEGPVLEVGTLKVEGLPESHALVWARAGEVQRKRGSELDCAAALAQDWPLVMRASHDDQAPTVTSVVVGGSERPVGDARLGRLLCLLAAHAGEAVEVARHKRALGIPQGAQTKRFVMLLRQLLDDTAVVERRSRFIASHYSEAYSFLCDTDFLLVCERPEDIEPR